MDFEQLHTLIVSSSARDSSDLECVWIVAEDMDRNATETFYYPRHTDELTATDVIFVLMLKLIDLEYHRAKLEIPYEIRPVGATDRAIGVWVGFVPRSVHGYIPLRRPTPELRRDSGLLATGAMLGDGEAVAALGVLFTNYIELTRAAFDATMFTGTFLDLVLTDT